MKKQSKRQSSPKQLRAIQTSRHLHVSHRKHTGHVLPRRNTSYPVLAMIVLCTGVLLAGWTNMVNADTYSDPQQDSYTVSASVPGPAPTQAPTIDGVANNAIVTTLPYTITGTCALNTYEALYRNGAFSGVAICDATGHYTMQTSLFVGLNQLQTRVFSTTDEPGPFSASVNVTYQPPVVTPPSGGGSTTGSGTSPGGSTSGTSSSSSGTTAKSAPNTATSTVAEPLIFKSSFKYQGHYTNQPTTWDLGLVGGTAPYAISVDWGDGTHSLLSRPRPGALSIEHTYKKSGGYKGSYIIKFSASDADGNQTSIQLLTIVNDPPVGAGAGKHNIIGSLGTGSDGSTPGYLENITKYVWPSYGIVVLMLASFWLGERRELQLVRIHKKKPRRR